MLLTDEEAADLKRWVMKKLDDRDTVDADPDILADYAIALVRADAPEASLREVTLEQLKDFLDENPEKFVDDLFAELNRRIDDKTKAVSVAKPDPAVLAPLFEAGPDPHHSHHRRISASGTAHVATSRPRKRNWQDTQGALEIPSGPRSKSKQVRRDGPRSTTHATSEDSAGSTGLHPLSYSNPGTLVAPTGPRALQTQAPASFDLSTFDTQGALAMMMTMMQQFPQLKGLSSDPAEPKQDCSDYFSKGRCERGRLCPYSHGSDPIIVERQEHDPQDSTAGVPQSIRPTWTGADRRGDGRGKNNRSAFSMLGPTRDPSNTTIVVERIPEDNFEEAQVRSFFAEFGPIEDMTMQKYKRLAIVRYSDHASAKKAWSSPKAIFDNRFVKVYWYDPETTPKLTTPTTSEQSMQEPEFDRAKFEKENAEAQRKHEARLVAKAEAEVTSQELEDKVSALLSEQGTIVEKLRARGVEPELLPNGKKKHHDTNALRAQLAALEEEARGMGIDPDAMSVVTEDSYGGVSRGRGFFRGGYRGRGGRVRSTWGYRSRGFDPARGAREGKGNSGVPFRGAIHAGGRYNLDLRPRSVKVSLLDRDATWTEDRDEALREHLFSLGEFESIESVQNEGQESSNTALVVVFKDRATAEQLYHGFQHKPRLGKLGFEWVANEPILLTTSTKISLNDDEDDNDESDTAMGNAPADGVTARAPRARGGPDEDDYDIAEVDERWEVS